MFAFLLVPILLLPAAAAAAPASFGDVVILTGSSVVRLDAANSYAPDAPVPVALADPRAIDVAPDGSVYIVDDGSNSILELSPNGAQRLFTPTGTRPWGPADETIDVFLVEPRDMAFGRDGRLWVADQEFFLQRPGGFDGDVVPVDPITGAIGAGAAPGAFPHLIDIGPFAGAVLKPDANMVVFWIEPGPPPEPFGFRACDDCDRLGPIGWPSVLRDGRIVLNGIGDYFGPAGGPFGEEDVADVSVFDSTGLLLDVFVDLGLTDFGLSGRTAGGIGDEFFFLDTPTSIARFDLETGTWAPIYDAGVPILDLAVQQIPEPSSLAMLAAALALTLRRRARDSARPR